MLIHPMMGCCIASDFDAQQEASPPVRRWRRL
jgi:hypothetical protein